MDIVSFFIKDYVALLGSIVLLGSIILFILVLVNLARTTETEEPFAEEPTAEKTSSDETDEMSLLETFLRSISDDLSEIKEKLNSISIAGKEKKEGISKDVLDSFSEQIQAKLKSIEIEELKKEMKEINTKLSAMYKILSQITEEKQ